MIYLQWFGATDVEHIDDSFALRALDVINDGVELCRHPLPVFKLSEGSGCISLFPHLITLSEDLHKAHKNNLRSPLRYLDLKDNRVPGSFWLKAYLFNLLVPHHKNILQLMHSVHICSGCFYVLKWNKLSEVNVCGFIEMNSSFNAHLDTYIVYAEEMRIESLIIENTTLNLSTHLEMLLDHICTGLGHSTVTVPYHLRS